MILYPVLLPFQGTPSQETLLLFAIQFNCLIVVISVCLSVCFFDHNAGTPGPIFLKFYLGIRESHGYVLSLILRFQVNWVQY